MDRIQTILRLIHVANWATENTCTFECFQIIKATSPIDKDANQTHLIGLRKLTSSKHGGKRDVVHTNITGEDGGDLGISHGVGGGGSLGGDTAVGHGRLGGERNESRRPGLGGHRRGEGIGAREEGDGAEGNSRESHLDGSIVEENAETTCEMIERRDREAQKKSQVRTSTSYALVFRTFIVSGFAA